MKELTHGLASTYNNHKCRCEKCKKAWAEYMRPRIKSWRIADKKKKRKGVSVEL